MNFMIADKLDISQLLKPAAYDHPVKNIELIETHISWVLLTGDFVYKLKKPVDFGFLDFSTLEKRRLYCEQEISLNRRSAPDVYLDVVSIASVNNQLTISGDGEVLEYAVMMRQFSQSCQLDNMLKNGELGIEQMDEIAHMIARFHRSIQIADETMDYGDKDKVYQPVEENFLQIKEHLDVKRVGDALSKLQQWSELEFLKLGSLFEQRKNNGFIRECHGDMHLRNMVWLDNAPVAFDCIEFNDDLRWIDVISEISFFVMDLQDRGEYQFSNRFLNAYLEVTGDYAGLSVLTFYLCYRALVRAKVDALRLEQKDIVVDERKKLLEEFESYIALANSYTQQPMPKLILMRGMSASGKSTVSQILIDSFGAIRIRSDVERKRLFNIALNGDASDEVDSGIYSVQASHETYKRLAELALGIIRAGYSVIIDAAFLDYQKREPFKDLACVLDVPFIIVETTAPIEVLRQRIVAREHDVSDADLTVLEHQLLNWSPLHDDEVDSLISVNTDEVIDVKQIIDRLNKKGSRCDKPLNP